MNVAIYLARLIMHRANGSIGSEWELPSFEPIAEQFLPSPMGGGVEVTGGMKPAAVIKTPSLTKLTRSSPEDHLRDRFEQRSTSLGVVLPGSSYGIAAWTVISLARAGHESFRIVDAEPSPIEPEVIAVQALPKPLIMGIFIAPLHKRWKTGEVIESRERHSFDAIQRNEWTPRIEGWEDMVYHQERARSPSLYIACDGWARDDFGEYLEHPEHGRKNIVELICHARNQEHGLRFVDGPKVIEAVVEAKPVEPPKPVADKPKPINKPLPPPIASDKTKVLKTVQGSLW